MEEKVVEKIINRYTCLFYPKNPLWLQCNMFWDVDLCKCLDKMEINVAYSLYEIIKNYHSNITFSFDDEDDNLYHMSIENKKCVLFECHFCEYCGSDNFVNHELVKEEVVFYEPKVEQRIVLKEAEIMYCVLCLLVANRGDRRDIIKLFFLKSERAFLKYLVALSDYVNGDKKRDISCDFFKYHVGIIEFILRKYADKESSNILGDVYSAICEEFFTNNYDCIHNYEVLRKALEEPVVGICTDELPALIIDIPKKNKTLIAVITDIIKAIKRCEHWKELKEQCNDIYNHIERILQKRRTEEKIKNDMKKMSDCFK